MRLHQWGPTVISSPSNISNLSSISRGCRFRSSLRISRCLHNRSTQRRVSLRLRLKLQQPSSQQLHPRPRRPRRPHQPRRPRPPRSLLLKMTRAKIPSSNNLEQNKSAGIKPALLFCFRFDCFRGLLLPNLFGDVFDEGDLFPLILRLNDVALFGGREATLGADAEVA